jgi:ubiquinone/menaquinone biosynthesis C-methylase UbiE
MNDKNQKKQKDISNINPFEDYTEKYENWFDNNKFAYLSELEGIKSLITKGGGIEIGVGTGKFAEALGIEFGIDPSLTMLKVAQKRKIKVIRGVGEHLPIQDDSFDFALLVTTLCFLKDTEQTFKEIKRILKKNGTILAFIDRESFLGMLYMKKKEKNTFYEFADFYSVKEVKEKLEKAGFSNPKIKQTLFSLPEEIKNIDDIKDGYGKGGFTIIRMRKNREV